MATKTSRKRVGIMKRVVRSRSLRLARRMSSSKTPAPMRAKTARKRGCTSGLAARTAQRMMTRVPVMTGLERRLKSRAAMESPVIKRNRFFMCGVSSGTPTSTTKPKMARMTKTAMSSGPARRNKASAESPMMNSKAKLKLASSPGRANNMSKPTTIKVIRKALSDIWATAARKALPPV